MKHFESIYYLPLAEEMELRRGCITKHHGENLAKNLGRFHLPKGVFTLPPQQTLQSS